ncbi:zinc-binding dehydrogenase [Chloroflexota bacterium]
MLKNIKLERPLAFIDVETTGLKTFSDKIVELSILKIHPDGNEEYKSHRVNPGIPIPAEATAIHGITDTDVAKEPTFPRYAKSICDFLEGCDIAGYNVIKFDLPLLEAEFARANVDFSKQGRFLVDSKVIYHQREPRDLQAAYMKYCGKEMENAHCAESDAAAVQPLAVSAANVETAELHMGDTVVVLGQGVIGLGCMQISRVSGAGLIIGVDVREQALDLSKRLGADVVIDANKDDPVAVIRDLTDGLGADVVFEAAGGRPEEGLSGTKTFYQAIDITRRGGKVVPPALLTGRVEIDPPVLRRKCIRLIYPESSTARSMRHVALLAAAKRIQIAPTITHTLHGIDKILDACEITSNKAKYKAINAAQVVVS